LARAVFFVAWTLSLPVALACIVAECTPVATGTSAVAAAGGALFTRSVRALALRLARCAVVVVLAGATVILVWIASAMLAVAGFFARFFCPIVVALVTRA
jgi:hypothetical protein